MLLTFLEEIEISKIDVPRKPLRQVNSIDHGIDELAASINEKGLLQPIVVRPVHDRFEVVAGNRRLEACKRLGWRKVTCHVVEFNDKEAYEASLVENIQRRTMNPIEEAQAFKNYIDVFGYGSVTELARKIGKSQEYVSKRLGLLRLPESVKDDLIRRRITPSLAEELTSLDEEETKMLHGLIMSKNLRREDIRYIKQSRKIMNDMSFSDEQYISEEKKKHDIHRALNQSIAALKVCLLRLDDIIDFMDDKRVIEHIGDDWMIREFLLELRIRIHEDINDVIKVKKKWEETRKYA